MLLAVLLGLVVLAAAEISVIVTVAHLIGGLLTAALLVASTVGGLWLVRRERRRAWEALREALARGVMPDRELADAAVILGGGALIAIPGFISDVAGLLAVAPFTRPAFRAALTRWVSRRADIGPLQTTPQMTPQRTPRTAPPRQPRENGQDGRGAGDGQVVQGEVLEERTEPPAAGRRGASGQDGDRAG